MSIPSLGLSSTRLWITSRRNRLREAEAAQQAEQEEQQMPLIRVPSSRRWITSRRIRLREAQKAEQEEQQVSRLRTLLPKFGNWFKPTRGPIVEDPFCSFFPCPKITFLLDPPDDLICSICQETELVFPKDRYTYMADLDYDSLDCIPVITPCGHVAGQTCMNTWLKSNRTCPFCRGPLTYECGHFIEPKRITPAEINLIPSTVPCGGVVPNDCESCTREKLLQAVQDRYQAAGHRLIDATARFQETSGFEEMIAMDEAWKEFENVQIDESQVRVEAWRLYEW